MSERAAKELGLKWATWQPDERSTELARQTAWAGQRDVERQLSHLAESRSFGEAVELLLFARTRFESILVSIGNPGAKGYEGPRFATAKSDASVLRDIRDALREQLAQIEDRLNEMGE